ncbi:hypothetical protein QBC43DRAFT_211149 [Cladorrhinum sp. PSN259]|nr:hypothetical protein QBC43DRAFT_211149 [Cladorrhinum sp. PSN259]
MTAVLFQTGVAHSKDKELVAAAKEIAETHRSSHHGSGAYGSPKPLDECRRCYNQILDLFLDRYSASKEKEWFTPLTQTYLSDLPQLIEDAKKHKVAPAAIDDAIYRARRAWYASKLRVLLPQVLSWDPETRQNAIAKLESGFKAGEEAKVLSSVNEALAKLGDVGAVPEQVLDELPARLVAAKNHNEQVLVLRQALFADDENEVPKGLLKYIRMLQQGMTLDQVVNDIMDTHKKAWSNLRDIEAKKAELNRLRRAKLLYETQKAQKAELRLQATILATVPDSVYSIPPCGVCGEEVSSEKFFSCVICSILGVNEIEPLYKRVYCSLRCEQEGAVNHRKRHRCAAGVNCIDNIPPSPSRARPRNSVTSQLPLRTPPKPQPSRPLIPPQHQNGDSTKSSSQPVTSPTRLGRSRVAKKTANPKQASLDSASTTTPAEKDCDIRFCTECITALKRPTHWCSLDCATKNFSQHRKEVHLPERRKLGIITVDERNVSDHNNYQQGDVERLTTTIQQGIAKWHDRYLLDVRLTTERNSG